MSYVSAGDLGAIAALSSGGHGGNGGHGGAEGYSYAAPQPIYAAPPSVYQAPPPVYEAPPPVYEAPPQVYAGIAKKAQKKWIINSSDKCFFPAYISDLQLLSCLIINESV